MSLNDTIGQAIISSAQGTVEEKKNTEWGAWAGSFVMDDKALMAEGMKTQTNEQLGNAAIGKISEQAGLPPEAQNYLKGMAAESVGAAVRSGIDSYVNGGSSEQVGQAFLSSMINQSPELATKLGADAVDQAQAMLKNALGNIDLQSFGGLQSTGQEIALNVAKSASTAISSVVQEATKGFEI